MASHKNKTIICLLTPTGKDNKQATSKQQASDKQATSKRQASDNKATTTTRAADHNHHHQDDDDEDEEQEEQQSILEEAVDNYHQFLAFPLVVVGNLSTVISFTP